MVNCERDCDIHLGKGEMKMKHKVFFVVITAMMLAQCMSCMSIDARNSKQQKRYANAVAQKMKHKPASPVIALMNESCETWGKAVSHHRRWISLFSDNTFLALDDTITTHNVPSSDRSMVFISGEWGKEEGAMVVLKHQRGTNLVDYMSIDLTSVTNFPSGSHGCDAILCPFKALTKFH